MDRIFSFVKKYIYEVVGLFLLGIALLLLAISTRGEYYTQQFFDGIRTTENRSEAIVIGVDDNSLQALGAWPWDRSIFAELTKKLDSYGIKAIIYDVLFLEPRSGDELFKEELSKVTTKVVLASKIDHGKYLPSFLATSSNSNIFSATSNVNPDLDGKVRRYSPKIKQGNDCLFSLGEQAFRIITFVTSSSCEDSSYKYFRYPTKITTYSLVDVLSDKIDVKNLKGKVAFIGSASLDLEDHFVSISGEKMPGVEVHASMFISLLNKEGDRTLSIVEIIFMIIIFMSIPLILLNYLKTILFQTIAILLTTISVFLVSYIFFSYKIIIPAPWLLLSVILSGGYMTLVRFLREKKQGEYVQSLFSKYVHKDVLSELMKTSSSLNFKGEKKEVTVLFSDLRGFTTLSESLSPEELTATLNNYFSAMTPAIFEEKGTIDKFIGDAIMAFWNAPLNVPDHQLHAVESALRMQESLVLFNKENKTSLAVGVGLHAGNVIVGNVGSKERVNYTILGDTVNIASRVESLTKKYGVQILVTEEVRNKIDDEKFMWRKLDVITVKGKSKATTLYEVTRFDVSKIELIKDYDIAFSNYQQGKFDIAKNFFKILTDKGDIPSLKMYERILSLKEIKGWDGVWHFDEK